MKIPQAKIKIPPEPPEIVVPDYLPKLHGLFMYAAIRGSGKTVACSNLVRMYKEADLAHKIILINPTFASNKYLWEAMVDCEDVYLTPTHDTFKEVLKKCEKLAHEWREWQKAEILYNKLHEQLQKHKVMEDIDEGLLTEALECGLLDSPEPPTYWAGRVKHPIIHLVIDDCQGTALFQPSTRNPLMNTCILHRHVYERMGITIHCLLQNWTGIAAGLPRSLRLNLTCCCLWGLRDSQMLLRLCEEFSGEIQPEVFVNMYEYATKTDKHDFLMAEWSGNRFRKNFDEILDTSAFGKIAKKDPNTNNDDDKLPERKSVQDPQQGPERPK